MHNKSYRHGHNEINIVYMRITVNNTGGVLYNLANAGRGYDQLSVSVSLDTSTRNADRVRHVSSSSRTNRADDSHSSARQIYSPARLRFLSHNRVQRPEPKMVLALPPAAATVARQPLVE